MAFAPFQSDKQQEAWQTAGAASLFPFQMQWAHWWLARHPRGTKGRLWGAPPTPEPHSSAHHLLISWIPKPGEDREVDAEGIQLQLAQATTQEGTKSDIV